MLPETASPFRIAPEATVTAMRAMMKGRPELQRAFAERVVDLFAASGLPVTPDVASALIPAVSSEFRAERAHVVAFDD